MKIQTIAASLLLVGAAVSAYGLAEVPALEKGEALEPTHELITIVETEDGARVAIGLDEVSGTYFIQDSVDDEMLLAAQTFEGPLELNPLAMNASIGNVASFGLDLPLSIEDGSLDKAVGELLQACPLIHIHIKNTGTIKLKNGCRLYWTIDLEVNTSGDGVLKQLILAMRGKKSNAGWSAEGSIEISVYCPPETPSSGEPTFGTKLEVEAGSDGTGVLSEIVEAIEALTM